MTTRREQVMAAALDAGLDRKKAEIFETIAKHSEFIGNWLAMNAGSLSGIASKFDTARDRNIILNELKKTDTSAMNEDEFMTYLRFFKMCEYTLIAAEDLCFGYSVEKVTEHISSFASAVCQAAYEYARAELSGEHGTAKDENGQETGFCIIGLGKLGGWELNFSSDIDIMYVYGSEKGVTDGDKPLDNHVFFCKIAEKITHYIGDRTKDGIVFRVDLRLRPDGERGPLAMPTNSYEIYYESHGQSWERMMLLKALPVAGDEKLGEEFIKKVKPFVFRRSLDYRLLSELQDVKRKINKRVELKGHNIKHVKLGYGGIREIEFIVQTMQILHYPKNPEVYNRNTLKSIQLLKEYNILEESTAKMLSDSYRFLRRLEHMVQIENERQTHIVPEGSSTFDRYLERCGFSTSDDFEYAYSQVTKLVNEEFAGLFSEDNSAEDSIETVFDHDISEEDAAGTLKEMGMPEPVKSVQVLRKIMAGPKSRPRLEADRKILKVLLPSVLKELQGRKDAYQILTTFEKLLSRSTTIYLLHDIFISAPVIVNRLINTFSYSSYLTNMILANIDLLDYVYDPKEPIYDAESVCRDMIEKTIKYEDDTELLLETSRIRHRAYIFNAGYAYLNKTLNVIDMMRSLTALAKGTVDYAFQMIYRELVQRYGQPLKKDGTVCEYLVVGMGKVGSIEMSFGSDIDMLFLFADQGETDGEKSVTNHEFFSKMVQRANSFLNTFTRNGFLYKTDMRLRPSGSSGTLVVTLHAFDEYHKKSAMVWEKQALLRSSVINENSPIAGEFQRIKNNALFECKLNKEGVHEIYDMRFRIEKEKGGKYEDNNIKAGFGGLLDIEFIAQMLQLMYGCRDEKFQQPNTHDALHAFKVAGIIKDRDFNSLHKGYLFFRHLENLVRIYENSDTSKIPSSEELRSKIAGFYGYGNSDPEELMAEYNNIRRAVRAAFNRIFERMCNETDTGS